MACREYEDELRELAAGELASARENYLGTHLAGCAACRDALENERRLFAAVDEALRQEVNADVPPSLEARIRLAVGEHIAAPRTAWWRWVALAGAAVAAVVVLMIALRSRQVPIAVGEPAMRSPSAEDANLVEAARTHEGMRSHEGGMATARSPERGDGAQAEERVEVMVPEEEKAAFVRFAESLRERRGDAEALLKAAEGQPPQGLEIPSLQVAKLEVKPIEEETADRPQDRE